MWDEQRSLKLPPGTASDRLERLHQQERVWFAWVCRLHDMHSETQPPHAAAILAIAQRRWTAARRALESAARQQAGPQPGQAAKAGSVPAVTGR
jgi:hypothetical protein